MMKYKYFFPEMIYKSLKNDSETHQDVFIWYFSTVSAILSFVMETNKNIKLSFIILHFGFKFRFHGSQNVLEDVRRH